MRSLLVFTELFIASVTSRRPPQCLEGHLFMRPRANWSRSPRFHKNPYHILRPKGHITPSSTTQNPSTPKVSRKRADPTTATLRTIASKLAFPQNLFTSASQAKQRFSITFNRPHTEHRVNNFFARKPGRRHSTPSSDPIQNILRDVCFFSGLE